MTGPRLDWQSCFLQHADRRTPVGSKIPSLRCISKQPWYWHHNRCKKVKTKFCNKRRDKWSSQRLGSLSLESNDVMIKIIKMWHYDAVIVPQKRSLFHQEHHLISRISYSRDNYYYYYCCTPKEEGLWVSCFGQIVRKTYSENPLSNCVSNINLDLENGFWTSAFCGGCWIVFRALTLNLPILYFLWSLSTRSIFWHVT